MITFGRKLKHLRQKNHLTQKELGIALGFPEDSADIRIAQYANDQNLFSIRFADRTDFIINPVANRIIR